MASNTEIAEQLFWNLSSGNFEAAQALCAPTMVIRQNGGAALGFESMTRLTSVIRRMMSDWRYENAVRSNTEVGFVEEHDACGTLPDGTEVRIPACIVATMADGLVTSINEYLDSAAAKPLNDAFAARDKQ